VNFVVIVKPLHDCRSSVPAHAGSGVRMVEQPANGLSKLSGIGGLV
jgi:hypothetical protein